MGRRVKNPAGTSEGAVLFLPPGRGGRQSDPPCGPLYAATAVRADELVLTGLAWRDAVFSVVIEFGSPTVDAWIPARISALVPGAPGSEVLAPGAVMAVLEGSEVVAYFRLDGQDGARPQLRVRSDQRNDGMTE